VEAVVDAGVAVAAADNVDALPVPVAAGVAEWVGNGETAVVVAAADAAAAAARATVTAGAAAVAGSE
jgi:hypothetical protein